MRLRTSSLLALAAAACCAASAHAAVPGTAPPPVAGAADLGPASGSQSFTVALAPRASSALDALIAAQRAGHARPLSPSAFNARFAPSGATVSAVTRWARAHGLRVESVSANSELVRLSGSRAAVGAALGTSIHSFRAPNGTTYRAPTRAAVVPSAFASRTAALVGLSDLGRVGLRALGLPAADLPNASRAAQTVRGAVGSLNFPAAYGPQDLWGLYNAPSGQTGAGQKVAVIAEGDLTQPQKDLVTFEQRFGLPTVPWTTVRVGAASTDTSGNDEWDLDTQYSTGLAPSVSSLTVYDGASLSNNDILATISRWVTDKTTTQASFSAGECELLASVTGFTTALDNQLRQATAQGQTLFTASGDTGSFCPVGPAGVNGVPVGLPNVSYPAASPYAIGVGGTTVLGPGPNEIAWYAGGGGPALTEAAPGYQSSAGGSFLGVQRGVPDVSLDADPNSGYRVIVAAQEMVIGGTSASSPAWEGIWARAQGAHGGSLGFAGPALYGTAPRSAYNDITVGANGFFPATPGWDYVTGLGTPNISALVAGA